jgi:hypothetical protein
LFTHKANLWIRPAVKLSALYVIDALACLRCQIALDRVISRTNKLRNWRHAALLQLTLWRLGRRSALTDRLTTSTKLIIRTLAAIAKVSTCVSTSIGWTAMPAVTTITMGKRWQGIREEQKNYKDNTQGNPPFHIDISWQRRLRVLHQQTPAPAY